MNPKQHFNPITFNSRGRLHHFENPVIMGILNITDDSFYDGGRYTDGSAIVARAKAIVEEGGDIIDIGAASTRPGAMMPTPEQEAERLAAAVALVRQHLPDAIISADTCYAVPAQKAIESGADIINDISGGQFDNNMFDCIAALKVPYILSHTKGTPDTMQQFTQYNCIIDDLIKYFSARLEQLYLMGVKDIWLDPGFGFAKTVEQNHELLDRLDELTSLFKEPFLAGISRKSMIYKKLNITPEQSLNGTTALNTKALLRGARILRVHDVLAAKELVSLEIV